MKFEKIQVKHIPPEVRQHIMDMNISTMIKIVLNFPLTDCIWELSWYLNGKYFNNSLPVLCTPDVVKAYDWINDCPSDDFLILLATERI